MNPLNALMRPISGMLNRNIHDSIEAKALAVKLSGSVVEMRVQDTPLSVFFQFNDGEVALVQDSDQEPRLKLSGSVFGFAALARGGDDAIRNGAVHLEGDSDVAMTFSKLLERAKPDPEEELANVIGTVAAHRVGEVARNVKRYSENTRSTLSQNLKEYLQDESGELPSRYEADRFRKALNALRDDVDRFEAKLNLVTERHT